MKCSACGFVNVDGAERCGKCRQALIDHDEVTLGEAQPSPQPSKTARSPKEVPTQFLDIEPTAQAAGASSPSSSSSQGSRGSLGSLGSRGSSGSSGSSPSSPRHRTGSRELQRDIVFSGRYRIQEVLGEGGMGVVYKAIDLELDKVIALKTIRGEKDTDPDIIQRFKRELLLARGITHKNVVRIHDFGEADGIKYFTMEYIEGESLKDRIRRRGRIAVNEALPMIAQMLSALQEAHHQDVIHRDLKPQNVMLDRDGVPHIMDFGIARSAMETTELTATGVMIGTPDYMSPEQVRGEKASPQSDIFSLGVILYEMLTGDLPYKADSPASKVMMRLSHKPRAPRQITLDIPKYLEQVVLKCMEVDPALRYRNAHEALQDLERQQVDSSLTLKVQKAVGRSKWWLGAAALLFLGVGAAFYFTRGGPESASDAVATTAPTTSLAILPFTNATGSSELEWMRAGLPEMLLTDIAQSQFVRPVPSDRVLKVMRELGVAENTRFDEAALKSISERAPADSVLFGQYVESGGELRLDLTLRKASSGVPTPISLAMPASEVFTLVDSITASVKSHLDLPPGAIENDTDRPVAEVGTGSLEALRSYQRGLADLNQGSNQAAIASFEEATASDANFAMAYAKLAEAQFQLGQHHEAVASIDRARRLLETSSLPLVERYQIHATEALVKNEYETAAKSLSELAEMYPRDPDIQLSLARAFEELGRLQEAQAAYQSVVRLAPEYGGALLGLGRVQVMSGSAVQAIDSLNRALDSGQFREDVEALGMIHSILGVAYRETGELDEALDHLNQSLAAREKAEDHTGQATTLHNLASIYEYRGELDQALAAEQKALDIARETGDKEAESVALNNMGLTYKVAGKLDKSLEAFRGSLRIEMERQDHTEMANRLDHIANLYELQGNYDDAIVYLEQAKSHLEQSHDKLERSINGMYIGRVRKAQGLYDDALTSFLAALALSREIDNQMAAASIQKHVADIYVNQGRYADALSALEQSLAIFQELHVEHDIAEVKAPLGHLLIRLGETEAAAKALSEAEHASHDTHGSSLMPEVHLGRAEILALEGKLEQAAAAYEEANVQANLSGKKEIAVSSRVELGRLFLRQGKTPNAERMLLRTRREAADARLRPLEAEAGAALAEVYLSKGDAEAARKTALEAIATAEEFSGKPTLSRSYAALGRSLQKLGRTSEAIDAYLRSAEILGWIRGSLRPEHVKSFMARADVRGSLKETVSLLEKNGRNAEAAPLKEWLAGVPAKTSDASEE
ncbi:MAG: protein kinase domain-containing protein [Vicinamibacteria bacterium]